MRVLRADARFYWAEIASRLGTALHIVTTYLDRSGRYLIMEFHRKVWNTDDSSFSLPEGRPLTFQEELRLFGYAEDFEEVVLGEEKKLIELKMKEAYGEDAEVNVEEISRV